MNNHRRLNRIERQRLGLAIWMALGSILLSVVLSLGIYLTIDKQQRRTDMRAISINIALCTFKGDLVRRVNDTRDFINQIQQGERGLIPGISIADLERSVANQQATIDALAALRCNT